MIILDLVYHGLLWVGLALAVLAAIVTFADWLAGDKQKVDK